MVSIKSVLEKPIRIDLIKNPISVFFNRSSKKNQLKMIFKFSHELVYTRSYKIVVLSFVVMNECLI